MSDHIQTERLLLSPPEPGDADRVCLYMQDKDVPMRLARAPWPYRISDAEDWIVANIKARKKGKEYSFILRHPDHGLIGSAGFVVRGRVWELGFWCGKPFWGQGYTSEASKALLDWARVEHDQHAFVAGHISDNLASGRVLRKLGFEPVGEKQMYVRAVDGLVTALRFTLNAEPEDALGDGHNHNA